MQSELQDDAPGGGEVSGGSIAAAAAAGPSRLRGPVANTGQPPVKRAAPQYGIDNEVEVELDGSQDLEGPMTPLDRLREEFLEMKGALATSAAAIAGLEREVSSLKERLAAQERTAKQPRRGLGAGQQAPPPAPAPPAPLPSEEEGPSEDLKSKQTVKTVGGNVVIEAGDEESFDDDPDEELSYALKETVWDSTFILGLRDHSGTGVDTAIGFLLCFLNIMIQVAFCLILAFETNQRSGAISGDENRFFDWRLGVGHHVKHFDPATSTSLTARVCSGYDAAILSYEQKQVSSEIDLYTQGFGTWGYGRPLCALAVGIWTLWVFGEMANIWEFMTALFFLPHSRHTVVAHVEREEGSRRQFKRLSYFRFWGVLFVSCIPRALIALALWLTGSFWLTYTRGMNDLILNCVALGFVMQVAEILYGFLPRRLRHDMSIVEPLQRHSSKVSQFVRSDSKSLLQLIVFAVFMTTWFATIFRTYHDNLKTTREILCGGEQDFVYTTHPITGVVKMADTLPLVDGDDSALFNGEPHVFDVVLQATGLVNDGIGKYNDPTVAFGPRISETQSIDFVSELYVATGAEASALVECEDLDQKASNRVAMRSRVQSDALCAELEARCQEESVRLFCPATCRCDDALSGYYNRTGCAPSCVEKVKDQHSELETTRQESLAPCQDGQHRLRNISFFQEFQEALRLRGVLALSGGGAARISREFKEDFEKRTAANWTLDEEVEVDMSAWFTRSLDKEETCWLVPHIIYIFQVDLCSMEGLDDGVGHLATLCPATCHVCTGGRLETVTQEWDATQHALQRLGVFLLRMRASLIFAGGNQISVCERPDTTPGEIVLRGDTNDGEGGEVLPGVTRLAPSLTYAFKAPNAGNYTFQLLASFKPVMNLWSAATFLKEHDGNSTRQESCLKVYLPAGGDFALVIGGAKATDAGNFSLQINCPWAEPQYLPDTCSVNPGVQESEQSDEEAASPAFGLQSSPCRGQVQFPVYGATRCEEAARTLDLVVTNVEVNAPWAPIGCTYLKDTTTLLVDGTGVAGTYCGGPTDEMLAFQCICSPEDLPPKYSKDVSECVQTDSGACRACVELLDDWCSVSLWDSMCHDLCFAACHEVCQPDSGLRPFDVELGPCGLTDIQNGQCVESPMFPDNYGAGQYCSISVRQPAQWQVDIRSFNTEEVFDILYINDIPFSGNVDGASMTLPQVHSIVWSSDALNSVGGWRLCAERVQFQEQCSHTDKGATNLLGQDCAFLAERSPYCSTEFDTPTFSVRTMCCHCHGGSTRSDAWGCPREHLGDRWTLVRRASSDTFPVADNLRGSAVWGTAHSDPLGPDMSIRFDSMVFDEFLFATGDCWEWMLMTSEEVQSWYNHTRDFRSHRNAGQSASKRMIRRPDTSPNINFNGSSSVCGMMYAEGQPLTDESCSPLHAGSGFNVFVRQKCLRLSDFCSASDEQYQLADCNADGWLDHYCTSNTSIFNGAVQIQLRTRTESTLLFSVENCASSALLSGIVAQCGPCYDVPGFVDEGGWICSDWRLYQCEYASEDFGYSQEGQSALLSNCAKSCTCPDTIEFGILDTKFELFSTGACEGDVLMEQPADYDGCKTLCTAYATCAGFSVGNVTERYCALFTKVTGTIGANATNATNATKVTNATTYYEACWTKAEPEEAVTEDQFKSSPTMAPPPSPAPPLELPCLPGYGYQFFRLSNGGPIRKPTCDATWSLHEVSMQVQGFVLALSVNSVSSTYEPSYYGPASNVLDKDLDTFWAGDPWVNETLTGLGTDCYDPSKAGLQWIVLETPGSVPISKIVISQHPSVDLFSVSLLQAECSEDNVSWTSPTTLPVAVTGSTTIFEVCPSTLFVGGADAVQPLANGVFTTTYGVTRAADNSWWPIYVNEEHKYLFFSASTTSWWIADDHADLATGRLRGHVGGAFCPQDVAQWLASSSGNSSGNWSASAASAGSWSAVDLLVLA